MRSSSALGTPLLLLLFLGCGDESPVASQTAALESGSADVGVYVYSGDFLAGASGIISENINVYNSAISSGVGVTLTATVNGGASFIDVSQVSGEATPCTYDAATITCTLGGGSYYVVRVRAPATPGTVTLQVAVTSTLPDPNLSNNQASKYITIIPPSANLRTYSDGPEWALVSSTFTFRAGAYNDGPTGAANVTLVDTLPDGVSVLSVDVEVAPPGSCAQTGREVRCLFPYVPASVTARVTITVQAPGAPAVLTNVATATADTPDPDASSNTATSEARVVEPSVDLDATILLPPNWCGEEVPDNSGQPCRPDQPIVPAGTIPFKVEVSNDGLSSSPETTMVVSLPAGAILVLAEREDLPASCTQTGTEVSCDVGELPVLQRRDYSFVATTPPGSDTFDVTVTVSSALEDMNPTDNTRSKTLDIVYQGGDPDLADPQVILGGPAQSGLSERNTIEVSYRNNGPGTAIGVEMNLEVAGAEILSVTPRYVEDWPPPCTVKGAVIACAFESLPRRYFNVLLVELRAPATAGTITVTGSIRSATPEYDPSDNQASFAVPVFPTTSDLYVDINAPFEGNPFDELVYRITVGTLGPFRAGDITVISTPPPGMRFVSASDPNCAAKHDEIVCTLAAAEPSHEIFITVLVPETLGVLTLQASATALTPDPNPANNMTTRAVSVVDAHLNLEAAVVGLQPAVAVSTGEGLTFGLQAGNFGPSIAHDTILTGRLPVGLSIESITRDGQDFSCTVHGEEVTCPIGDLGPGEVALIVIQAIAPSQPGSAWIDATVSSNTHVISGFTWPIQFVEVEVASCADALVYAGEECTADASIDVGSGPGSCVQSPAGPYPLGTTDVTLTCTRAGVTGSCVAQVTVVDISPPALSCPGSECASGEPISTPWTNDNCSAVSVTCNATEGTEPGSCVARDAAGNEASCSVTPDDTWPPDVSTNADENGFSVSYTNAHGGYRTFKLSDCITAIVDQCEGDLKVKDSGVITRITSDERYGDRCGEAIMTSDTTADLRADRDDEGDGRVYTVFFTVSDEMGNPTHGRCKVGVPRNGHEPAVGGAAVYCVGTGCGAVPGDAPGCTGP